MGPRFDVIVVGAGPCALACLDALKKDRNSPGRSGGVDFADNDIGFFLKGLDEAPALLAGGRKHAA